jgi:hypothetical protein
MIKSLPKDTLPRFHKPFKRLAGRKLGPGGAPEAVSRIPKSKDHETAAEAA